jgi:Glycerophosphoryl diester phosphodiesterase family
MRQSPAIRNGSFALLTLLLLTAASMGDTASSGPANTIVLPTRGVCAHRGAMATHPENTVAALKEAVRLGVHAVEFDVHWTKDRQFVLMHDSTVDRTTDGTGKVSNFTLAEIRKLDVGSWKGKQFTGERIPTLKEALEMMPENIWLFIDIQGRPHLAAPVTREVLRHNRRHQCMLLVVTHEAAKAARQVDSSVLVSSMNQPGHDTKNVTDIITRGYNALRISSVGPPENMRRLKEANMRILFWSSTKPWPPLNQLFGAGINFPVANDPRKMLTSVSELGIKPWKPAYRSNE